MNKITVFNVSRLCFTELIKVLEVLDVFWYFRVEQLFSSIDNGSITMISSICTKHVFCARILIARFVNKIPQVC